MSLRKSLEASADSEMSVIYHKLKSQAITVCTTLIFQMILKWRPCGVQAAMQSQSNKGK